MIYKKLFIKDIEPKLKDSEAFLEVFCYEQNLEYKVPFLRPAMLVLPGGGYSFVSRRENEPIAFAYMAEGFNCFTLTYSVNKKYPTPHLETAAAMKYIHDHAKEYYLYPNCTSIVGFSAGGHLAGSYGNLYPEVADMLGYDRSTVRPMALVLSYAVTMMNSQTHAGSRTIISGNDLELLRKLDIPTNVTSEYPPTFLWTTRKDDCVPPKNTYILHDALDGANVLNECVIYENIGHGMSLGTYETNMVRDVIDPDLEVNSSWLHKSVKFIFEKVLLNKIKSMPKPLLFGADPNILFDKKSGYYYTVATFHGGEKQFIMYKSKNLENWEEVGFAYDIKQENNWGKDWFWAPEIYYNENNDTYYLFYSARTIPELTEHYFKEKDYLENCKLGVAVSKNIEGPYINITNRPIEYYPYDPNYLNVDKKYPDIFNTKVDYSDRNSSPKGDYLSMIDVNLFIDEDKRTYLFFSRCCYHNAVWDEKFNKFIEESNICAVELKNDFWFTKEVKMPEIKDEYVNVVNGNRQDKFNSIITYHNDPQDWENGHVNDYEKSKGSKHNRRWSEGSSTFIRYLNGKKTYCLTYSCNNFENALYGVGIAFASSPLGPYKKYENNPIISIKNPTKYMSLGHGSPIEKDGQLYYFHHGRNNEMEERSLFITPIDVKSINDVKVGEIKSVKSIEQNK